MHIDEGAKEARWYKSIVRFAKHVDNFQSLAHEFPSLHPSQIFNHLMCDGWISRIIHEKSLHELIIVLSLKLNKDFVRVPSRSKD